MRSLNMCNPEDFTTEQLITELVQRRGIKYIQSQLFANRVEVVIDDCNKTYINKMPDGTEYKSHCVYDEFHNDCKGIILIER